MMKRRETEPKPASRDTIRKHYTQFITELPKRYRRAESGYNLRLYALMAECATLAKLAADEAKVAEEIRNGEHWCGKRQQCPEDEYVKLVVHHMLQPEGRNEQSKASKWTAVIEHLSGEGDDGGSIVKALSKGGGIEQIYAETTGRNAAKAKSAAAEASKRSVDDIESYSDRDEDEAEGEVDHNGQGTKRTNPSKTFILEVMLDPIDFDRTLDAKVVDLRLTIGGAPVPGKSEGFKRVVGRIRKIVK